MGFVQNVWQLFGARACMGVFSGFSAAAIAMVGTQVPEESLGFSLGWMTTGQLVGGLCGPLFGGFLADALHDYRQVFFVTSLFALAAALVCIAVRARALQRPINGRSCGNRRSCERCAKSRRIRQLAPMFVVVLLAQVVAFGVQPVVAALRARARRQRALARDRCGPGVCGDRACRSHRVAVSGQAQRPNRLSPRAADLARSAWPRSRFPKRSCTRVGAFIALRFGVGLFLGGVLPTANALIGRIFPLERRGQVFGITSSATFLGMFSGPLLGGTIAARFGFEAAFVTIGAMALANFAWVSVSVRRSPAGAPIR